MQTLTGKSIYNEIAFGRLFIYKREPNNTAHYSIDDVEGEINRFTAARDLAVAQLETLYQNARPEIGEHEAMIFRIHQLMLNDIEFDLPVKDTISTQKINAEAAVELTCGQLLSRFAAMEDSYLRERAADIQDICKRVISILSDTAISIQNFAEPVIIVADDLAPSETIQFDKSKIKAFVTERGAQTSHTAILARTMNIPALIDTKGIFDETLNGKEAIVDGFSGRVYIQPDEETISSLVAKKQNRENERRSFERYKNIDCITKDGRTVSLYANVNSLSELESVCENEASGIGLFRSEFLCLKNHGYPDEEVQFEVYRKVVESMKGKRATIRTFDVGADKSFDAVPKEENPTLGLRAVRMYMKHPDILRVQLRALLRASVYGQLAIMIPMVISPEEVRYVKNLLECVKNELIMQSIPFSDHVEFGIMIETPAAAMISDVLAAEVDFFSIGTNDLTQYTLALDRQNTDVADLYDPRHHAVLRLIKIIIDNAHKKGIRTCICGESASDPALTETLLALGIDELSVNSSALLPLRKKIIETDLSQTSVEILNSLV